MPHDDEAKGDHDVECTQTILRQLPATYIKWTHLVIWALILCLVRTVLLTTTSSSSHRVSESHNTDAVPEGVHTPTEHTQLTDLHRRLSSIQDALEALAVISNVSLIPSIDTAAENSLFTMQRATMQLSELEKRLKVLAAQPGSENAATVQQQQQQQQKPQQQEVSHLGPDTYFAKTRSGVPPLTATETEEESVFCDELRNTFPMGFYNGAVPVEVSDAWCRSGSLGRLVSLEHRPQGLEEKYLIPFTVLQVYRHAYLLAQFQDRVIRYREAFQPLIDAIEERGDRMLYNYI